jgi:hypothetical protein
MYHFNKKFVHFMWSDELEGKTVFFADYIPHLQRKVENNDIEHYTKVTQSDELLPFRMKDGRAGWQFVYFDPNYELKLAHEQGKKIECKRKGDAWGDLDWDYTPDPAWLDDHEYRIMPEEKPITNRELAQWLAEGYGQFTYMPGNVAMYHYSYSSSGADTPIHEDIRVRLWEDTEWHMPTRKYMGLK